MSIDYEHARELLEIHAEDLEGEFIQAPGVLAYLNEQYILAEQTYLRAKFALEATEARLKIRIREQLTQDARTAYIKACAIEENNEEAAKKAGRKYKKLVVKEKVVTVSEIDNQMLVMDEYQSARLHFIEAECEAKKLKGWFDVGRVKRDMLTNLGMRANAEMRSTGLTSLHDSSTSTSSSTGSSPSAKQLSKDDPTDPPF